MKNKKLLSFALAGAMVLGLTACGNSGGSAETTAAGTEAAGTEAAGTETTTAAESTGNIGKTDIVFAMQGDIVALDPANQQDTTSSVILKHIYSTLLDTDND